MLRSTKRVAGTAVILALGMVVLAGCQSQSERNQGARYGAAGGALVGLTMGALAGEGKYAAGGAVAGAVVGGAAGAWADYQNDRQDYRAETIAGAIAETGNGGEGEAPVGWHDIDAFVGEWRVTMWFLDAQGQRVDATAKANSTLDTTNSVTFRFSDFNSDGFSEPVTGQTTLRFESDRGFEMTNSFSTSPEGNRYVGHFDNQANKYKFFFAGSNSTTYSGVKRTDYRLEMQMVGQDVIVIETWAAVGSEEKRIQSYRLNRV